MIFAGFAILALAAAIAFHAVVAFSERSLLVSLLTDVQALDASVVALTAAIVAPTPVDDPEVVAAVAQTVTDFGLLKDRLAAVGATPPASE